ncbi:hypothetical protein DAPPUDRAFT_116065 [Daphnia pulex]|uniref:Uncharacterized protein n=1 Tax=Daphnia pulex TaxID=6669 RepID=E9HNF1_DAPPU|nr:hypothetical protein DAPPUDRAFT_116065 [Daphnia pulex]|eukprot:EFX66745.1 hypothetical protein DAPPUDRAFT_116065 [Daphnia pulex]
MLLVESSWNLGQLWNEFFAINVAWSTELILISLKLMSNIEISIVTSFDGVGLETRIGERHDGEVGHRKNCLAGNCVAISSPAISSITYRSSRAIPKPEWTQLELERNELDLCPIQRPAVSTTTADSQFQGLLPLNNLPLSVRSLVLLHCRIPVLWFSQAFGNLNHLCRAIVEKLMKHCPLDYCTAQFWICC